MTSAGIMPRIFVSWALLVGAAACSFDAPYGGGHYTCSDGVCPSGLVCTAGTCVVPGMIDAFVPDVRQAALTCADPGPIATAGGTFTGTTTARSNTVSASCSGGIMNAPDAVYRFDATLGDQLTIAIAASWAANAYAIAPCSLAPATPTCLGSTAATPSSSITITAGFTGPHFIVVDGINPAVDGSYTLTITR
jgi:hypothetical protein